MKLGRISVATIAVGVALGLAACGGGASTATGGTVKIGIKFDQPGLGLKSGADYTGMDVDLAKYLAKELSLGTPEFVEAVSAQRETLIQTDQVKFIVGTYSITDARKEKISFGGPYFIAGQDLLVRADDTSITGPDTLDGKKLCSVTGSTSAQKVKDKVAGVNLVEFGTYSECLAALLGGGVDALTTDDTILAGYAAQEANKGKLKVVGAPFSEERYGVGLKKGDVALCEKVNAALKKMVEDGSWQKAVDANLGPAGYKAPAGNPPHPRRLLLIDSSDVCRPLPRERAAHPVAP